MAVEYRKHEIVSGIFIVLALAVFALFAFKVGKFDLGGLFSETVLECVSYMDDVGGLEADADVKVGGQRVGTVRSIELVGAADLPRLAEGEGPIQVRFTIDGWWTGSDLAADRRSYGASPFETPDGHGFEDVLLAQLAPGPHEVCAHALNDGQGPDAPIGCQTIVLQ